MGPLKNARVADSNCSHLIRIDRIANWKALWNLGEAINATEQLVNPSGRNLWINPATTVLAAI